MIHSVVTGQVTGEPQYKQDKNGKSYRVFNLKGDSEQTRVMYFDEFLSISQGDIVSVSGQLEGKVWTPENGEPRVSYTIFARSGIKAGAK